MVCGGFYGSFVWPGVASEVVKLEHARVHGMGAKDPRIRSGDLTTMHGNSLWVVVKIMVPFWVP